MEKRCTIKETRRWRNSIGERCRENERRDAQ